MVPLPAAREDGYSWRNLKLSLPKIPLSALRAYSLAVGCACVLPYAADAQQVPAVEVFAGYSYLHNDTQGTSTASLMNQCTAAFGGVCPLSFQVRPGFQGWSLVPQFNFTRWLGIKLRIAGQYGSVVNAKYGSNPTITYPIPKQHAYDVLFGPVVSRRSHRYTLFAHGLFGMENFGIASSQINAVSLSEFPRISTSDTAFAVGGGADVRVWKYFGIRAGELDYQFVNNSNYSHFNDWRYSAGIVVSLGLHD